MKAAELQTIYWKMSFLRSSINTANLLRTVNNFQVTDQTRYIKRYVAPTLRELRKRAKQLGPQEPQKRSEFLEWNYRAELFGFSKRLHEEFQLPLLQNAFTQRSYIAKEQQKQRDVGIEETDIQLVDNENLAERGRYIVTEYAKNYLRYSLPKLPDEGHLSLLEYLTKQETLAYVGLNIGMKDLILAEEYPPSEESLANSLLAVIGALERSSGLERAFDFVRDFVCTQLNQRDMLDLWNIEKPEELLAKVCKEQNIQDPEPRLLGDAGKNTVLAAYHVGLYSNKKMIGKGFGEDIETAIKTASLDALQKLFGIQDNMRPFNFTVKVESKGVKPLQN